MKTELMVDAESKRTKPVALVAIDFPTTHPLRRCSLHHGAAVIHWSLVIRHRPFSTQNGR